MLPKLALLIDAENISYKDLPRILKETSRQGEIVLRAVYGDWKKPILGNWANAAKTYDFKIRHQTSDSQIKNATDMKLIMDAMEVLYRTPVEVFCLVSNDADYVPLCDKIRESKKYVIGMGYQHAAEALIRACDQFIFIGRGEINRELISTSIETPKPIDTPNPIPRTNNSVPSPAPIDLNPKANNPAPIPASSDIPKSATALKKMLTRAFAKASQNNDGWVTLSALGSALSQIEVGFKTTTYGHPNLSKLLESMPHLFELELIGTTKSARLKIEQANPNKLKQLLSKAFLQAEQDANRWVTLSTLGTTLIQIEAGFKPNTYGHATLSKLLQSMSDFVELQTKSGVKSARLKK